MMTAKNILQALVDDGTLSLSAVEQKIEDMTKKNIKEAVVNALGKEPKIYNHNDQKRVYTKIKVDNSWKPIYGYSVDELYKNLYDILVIPRTYTLTTLLPEFMLYRRNMNKVSPKTIQENMNDWNKYIKDTPVANIPLKDIRVKDYLNLFESITLNGSLTRKRVSNIKSLLNKMYAYAIREELVDINPVHSIDFSEFRYYVPDNSDKIYTVENRQKLLSYLQTVIEPYSLAIQLDFQITARIGEIKALKWSDIDFENRSININKQVLRHQYMNDDLTFGSVKTELVSRVKGNSKAGKRRLHMTNEAYRILTLAKELNPDGEYVFMPYGRVISTYTFNQNLKRYCENAGVPYFSSHIIRFTSCSNLYNATDLAFTSSSMGHSTKATTLHYIRDINKPARYNNQVEEAFSVLAPNCTKQLAT